jgi:DNA uptake protein ComE-like DNA-binding protein
MRRASRPRRGIVLIIALVVVAMLSLGAYAFSELMLTESEAVDLYGQQLQARALAESGIDVARLFLRQDWETRYQNGGVYDNPGKFQGRLIVDNLRPELRGRFTLIAPMIEDGNLGGTRYGLENESTKLNLNALLLADEQTEEGGRQLLMALPGMTQDVADAILDWIDDDDEVREYGAELDHYSGLDPPYAPRNGPLETVEELLLVRGVTPAMLFGVDVNRNGMVDSHEQAGAAPDAGTAPEGAMDRGWSAYLTLYSQERNVTPAGDQRIYLNQEDMATLHAELSAVLPREMANFIVAYRQNGPARVNSGDDDEDKEEVKADAGELDLTAAGKVQLTQVLDLVGAKTTAKFQGDEKTSTLSSPFPSEILAMGFYMPLLMDNCTVNQSETIPGRININQASRVVLAGIPGMDEEIINQIISLRDAEPDIERPNRRHETWLLVEAVVSIEQMRALTPFITGGGDVYRTQAIGYFEGGHAASRAEVIIDATEPLPAIVSWRDVSHLGRGYALETLGISAPEE